MSTLDALFLAGAVYANYICSLRALINIFTLQAI